jgi:hypothetical protein
MPQHHKLRRLLTPHVPVRPRLFPTATCGSHPPSFSFATTTNQDDHYATLGLPNRFATRKFIKRAYFSTNTNQDDHYAFGLPHRFATPKSIQRAYFSTTTNQDDHYATLGLSNRSATPELIKRAYFVKAKLTHPDLHPTDPTSKAQFQKVNQAYQILKDPEKKAHYDLYGTEQPGTGAGQDDWHAEAWKDAWHTYGFDHYLNALKEDAHDAVDDIRYRNDWHLAQRFASKNKLLLLGVFVPFALALRYPPLILGGLRWAFTIAGTAYMYLPRRQQRMIMNQIWALVKHSTKRGGKSGAGNGW